MEKSQILDRLRQYTEDLYRKPDNDNSMEPIVASKEEREPDILLDEVKDAILLFKNNKAATGEDQIQAELIKEAGDLGAHVIHKLRNTIWRTMKWPEQWTQAIFVLLPKLVISKKARIIGP